jgi:glucose/arabinose dehydrogenase
VRTPSHGVVTAPRTPAPDLAKANVKLTKLASFNEPVAMALRPNDPNFYIVQKSGQVLAWRDGKTLRTVLDVSSDIVDNGEQGLLGLAFSPDGKKLYVYYTQPGSEPGTDCGLPADSTCSGYDVLREYAYTSGKADPSSARDILRFADPYPNHNGGNLAFGPDGYLYFGLGDGGSGGDPQDRAQNLDSPFGKMFRFDPTPSGANPYTVPPSNPFASSPGTKALVWAYGLRNPWRWSFDRKTKDLWIGDVGQDMWEEIDFQPASDRGGDNYGWNRMEGNHPYNGGSPPANYHRPIYEYDHSNGNCSVTGGYMYRGAKIHDLEGAYVFGDFCGGELRAFTVHDNAAAGTRNLGVKVEQLSSFGQDASGELYAFSLAGSFYRVDPA